MDWPASVTYLLLVVLGYALTRVVDLACAWQRSRLSRGQSPEPMSANTSISATAHQRLMERRVVYDRFRKSVSDAVVAAVNQGQGSYGMLYQIRDDYGDLLRQAPTAVTHAADSVIRCVTLIVNLGPSDARYAMFTRSLKHFDEASCSDDGVIAVPPGPTRFEFSVAQETVAPASNSDLAEEQRT